MSPIRPILESQIRYAQSVTRSGREAARYLNVCYRTYKKYAKMYGIHEVHKNQAGKNIQRRKYKGLYGLDSILNGEHPNYDRRRLKERLIAAGYLPPKCALCGYDTVRHFDGRLPVLLWAKDGNYTNLRRENLELRCYNCVYLTSGFVSANSMIRNYGVHEKDVLDLGLSAEDIQSIQNELMGN